MTVLPPAVGQAISGLFPAAASAIVTATQSDWYFRVSIIPRLLQLKRSERDLTRFAVGGCWIFES